MLPARVAEGLHSRFQQLRTEELRKLRDHVPPDIATHPPLSLAALSRTKCVATPLLHSTPAATLSPSFNALTHMTAAEASSNVQVLSIAAHLVATLTSKDSYFLLSTSSRTATHAIRIIIAPPPPPSFQGGVLYVRDWRFVPSRTQAKSHIEALLRDIVLLSDDVAKPQIPYLSSSFSPSAKRQLSVYATVAAKSPLLNPKKAFTFLVELFGTDNVAVLIVFRGDALQWWPFILEGSQISIIGLRLAKLPAHNRQVLLADSRNVQVYLSEDLPLTAPPAKRPRLQTTHDRQVPVSVSSHQRLISYEGNISKVLRDGRYLMDERVTLHLGELHSAFGVEGAFRPGARIRIHAAVALRTCTSASIFPTARTHISILYFGDLHASDVSRAQHWSKSIWCHLWRRLNSSDILWSQELFESLREKFGSWFCGSGSLNEDELTECLLGTENTTGLVQYFMFLHSDRSHLLNVASIPRRDMHSEFFDPLSVHQLSNVTAPFVPSLGAVRNAIDLCWKQFDQSLSSRRSAVLNSGQDVLSISIEPSQILKALLRLHRGGATTDYSPTSLAIVGTVESVGNGTMGLMLSDVTDSMHVQCIGSLQPSLLGAMVCISSFTITVESFRKGHGQKDVTFLFAADAVQIVVDGPCAHMDGENGDCRGGGSMKQTATGSKQYSQQQYPLTQQLSQRMSSRFGDDSATRSRDFCIADVPLIAIFVEGFSCRSGEFVVCGRLLAYSTSRADDVWNCFDKDKKGFWRCGLVMTGRSALQMAPAFHRQCVYAVSCTELHGKSGVGRYLHQKALHSAQRQEDLEVETHLEKMFPWVENLGRGTYMRFCSGGTVCGTWFPEGKNVSGVSEISGEGEMYLYVTSAVEKFLEDGESEIERRLWKLYHWSSINEICARKRFHMRGVVVQVEEERHGFGCIEGAELSVTIVDEVVGVYSATIGCRDKDERPRGLMAGAVVEMYNVVRVYNERQENGRFSFLGSRETVVKVLSYSPPRKGAVCCRCVHVPKRRVREMQGYMEKRYLSEFGARSELQNGESCAAGLVRMTWLKIEWMRLAVRSGVKNCMTCGVVEDELCFSVDMSAKVKTDDGSGEAGVLCRGFQACTQLLGVTEKERKALKVVAVYNSGIEMGEECGVDVWEHLRQAPEASHESVRTVYEMLGSHRTRCGMGMMVNSVNTVGLKREEAEVVDEVIVKGFRLGFGRKVWTACLPKKMEIVVECVAFFEESFWSEGIVEGEQHKAVVGGAELLRYLADAV